LGSLAFSFNGGKDCTVLMDLLYNIIINNKKANDDSILTVYFESPNPFPEITQFIESSKQRYGLNMVVYQKNIKEGLMDLLVQYPQIKAIFVGTRKTDPYSAELKPFSPTDKDWPKCMRICPILEWTYHDVWAYLLSKKVPYCSLYDRGYTSLGTINNTTPNEYLRTSDGFEAAFALENPESERNGR